MPKGKRIQVVADETLVEQLDHYVQARGVSHSQASKELMTLGYSVWQKQSHDESSMMEILKCLLQSTYSLQILFNTTLDKAMQKTSDEHDQPYPAEPFIKLANRLAAEKIDDLLQKKKTPTVT